MASLLAGVGQLLQLAKLWSVHKSVTVGVASSVSNDVTVRMTS